ncbi:hypothetical protein P7K49_026481 [Saguinus oedipus]|uniref:Uncharacterized protein n=1 Tax=Saguinus oedipus TaxID=9490 RepID=A0ABQ9UE56_SAGOE|nr:hypothetical protein P7K49_026481 [Saguinus oedipus]
MLFPLAPCLRGTSSLDSWRERDLLVACSVTPHSLLTHLLLQGQPSEPLAMVNYHMSWM